MTVFRSPAALVTWWGWLLFAAAILIDLAVQARGRVVLLGALILLLVTGIVYATALRPRLLAGPAGLTVVNPLTSHRIGWAAVTGAEPAELLRVRCAWPDGAATRHWSCYVWAVHSARRRQLAAELRAQRRSPRAPGGPGAFAAGGLRQRAVPAPDPDPLRVDAGRVVAVLTELADQSRRAAPGAVPAAPESSVSWPALAALAVPGVALLLAALL